jgi:hypothetical protein
VAIFPY